MGSDRAGPEGGREHRADQLPETIYQYPGMPARFWAVVVGLTPFGLGIAWEGTVGRRGVDLGYLLGACVFLAFPGWMLLYESTRRAYQLQLLGDVVMWRAPLRSRRVSIDDLDRLQFRPRPWNHRGRGEYSPGVYSSRYATIWLTTGERFDVLVPTTADERRLENVFASLRGEPPSP